ncbi:MAG TPA: hypothetical protein VLL95_13715, partial [Phnomibacter sp.]|nr:hypothetical protein [Phnomibacter sp.]
MRKPLLTLSVACSICFISFSQSIGIGTNTPHADAALEVASTSKGILIPRVALTAANAAAPL